MNSSIYRESAAAAGMGYECSRFFPPMEKWIQYQRAPEPDHGKECVQMGDEI